MARKRHWIWTAVVVSMALNIAFIGGYIYSGRQAAQAARPGAAAALAQRLGWEAQQQAGFTVAHRKARQALVAHVKKDRQTVEEYWRAMVGTQTSDAHTASLLRETADRRVALNRELTQILREFLMTLTPGQRLEFVEILKSRTVFGGRFLMSGTPRARPPQQVSEIPR